MKALNKTIEILAAIETRITCRRAAKSAAPVVYRIALNGCRV